MKKGIVIGLLGLTAVALFGCQQKPAVQPTVQTETTTASIKITETQQPQTQATKATLEIKPATEEEASKATLEVKPE